MSRGLRYRVIRKIAHGGMAEIFLAMQVGAEGFEKPVVLKRILPSLAADPGFVRMLVDEAHIASSLSHSHLVQVLDLGKVDDQFFLALEFVDGFSLEQIRRRAQKARLKLPLPLTLYIVSALCRGLDYVHRRTRNGKPLGIVHRDVTPQNVLVSREGDVKLADFGIAKARGRREKSVTGVIKGKFAYMSPEQSMGAELDARSDLFSVGTLLYVLTTGKKPFAGVTDLDVLMQVRKARFEKPCNFVRDFNPDVERFLTRALRSEKSRRWQSAEQMADRLDAILFKLGQPVGPAALKRWMETLSARDGVAPPGDLKEAAQHSSNETVQLSSQELELQEVAPPSSDDVDDDEISAALTLGHTWKRVPPAHDALVPQPAPSEPAGTSIGDAATVVAPIIVVAQYASTSPHARSDADAVEVIERDAEVASDYEFTLYNPIPGSGNTFTGTFEAEATELALEQTLVSGRNTESGEHSTEVADEPLQEFAAVGGELRPRNLGRASDRTLVMQAIPARPRELAPVVEAPRLVARRTLALKLDDDDIAHDPRRGRRSDAPPYGEDASAMPSAIRRWATASARFVSATVLVLAAAAGGAYAARAYVPPELVPPVVFASVDSWLTDVFRRF